MTPAATVQRFANTGRLSSILTRPREDAVKEVTCMCGWQARGTDDEVVLAIQDHGEQVHGRRPSREEILELAVDLGDAGDAETA